VAYDQALADRVREALAQEGVTGPDEQPMFGGLAFLVRGNMAVAVSSKGGLMVRVPPDETDEILDGTVATPMVMRGKAVHGWIRVAADHVQGEQELRDWVGRGLDYARALPAK
jgi:TfoX/Sxy family transcriptional regulator of competence genes